ncbi:MAG TPA: hypothetical protein VGH15_05915 [Caulobacteraceae bacterium]|jgi:hypothetical protein
MNADFEPVMAALLARFQAATVLAFTADATATSPVLANVSSFTGLFVGLPVTGPGAARGATIAALDPGARTVTLTDPAETSGTAQAFTAGFLSWSRRLQHWGQGVPAPAGFLRRIGFEVAYDELLPVTTVEAEVWIYCDAGEDPDLAPDVGLAALEQLVAGAALAPDTDYGDPRCTLAGTVYWARIEGRADSWPGDQAGRAVSRIPLRITLP